MMKVYSTRFFTSRRKKAIRLLKLTRQKKEDALPKFCKERQQIAISKIGFDHEKAMYPNQDFFICGNNFKIVMDGCGSSKYSDVGTKLFSELIEIELASGNMITADNFPSIVENIFNTLTSISSSSKFSSDVLCFTILACFETPDAFVVYTCGDGYILGFNHERLIDMETCEVKIVDGAEYPRYYIYNYEENELFEDNKLRIHYFSKAEYNLVGVATDGYRYYKDLNEADKKEFLEALYAGKPGSLGKIINRSKYVFRDDITICL